MLLTGLMLSVVLSLVFSPALLAQADLWVACSLPLAPHTMPDAAGEPSGQASEILMAVAGRLGWQIEVRYMPWLRVVNEAKRGRCDLVYTVLPRTDYEEFLLFPSEPVQMRSNVLVVRADSGINFDGDLERFMQRYTVGLYQDKAVDERFEILRREPWSRVDVSVNAHLNMLKLINGRIDAAIENDLTASYELQQIGDDVELTFLQPPLSQLPAYIAFARTGRLVSQIEAFDRALADFRKTPEYGEIQQRYLLEAR